MRGIIDRQAIQTSFVKKLRCLRYEPVPLKLWK